MVHTDRAPRGTPGELVERLMAVVGADPPGISGWWFDLGVYVAEAIGGEPGPYWPQPSSGSDARSTMGDHATTDGRDGGTSRATYLEQLQHRLSTLVGTGLDEAFLVGALRDHIDAQLRRLAGGDPAPRPHFAGQDVPRSGLMPLRSRSPMGRMLVGTLALTADDACERWNQLAAWRELAASLLSDEAIAVWRRRSLMD